MTTDHAPGIALSTHVNQAVGRPDLIQLGADPPLYVLRFETMKALSARCAVRHLLDTGRIAPGDTVVDSSSGIYAHALALACHEAGLRCAIVGSTTVDPVLAAQLRVLGVYLEQMPPSTSLRMDQNRRVARIRELLRENPGWHWMRQYHSAEHYLGYGPVARSLAALLRSRGHEATRVVAPVGSGASSGALLLGLRGAGMPAELVGVQPFGSVTFGSEHVEDPDMLIAGIGSSIEFQNVRHALYSRVHWVSFGVGKAGAVELLRRHAVFAGLSSGAAFAAATWETQHGDGTATVFVAPDTGHRYVDAVFADVSRVQPLAEHLPEVRRGQVALPWSVMDLPGPDAPEQPRSSAESAAGRDPGDEFR